MDDDLKKMSKEELVGRFETAITTRCLADLPSTEQLETVDMFRNKFLSRLNRLEELEEKLDSAPHDDLCQTRFPRMDIADCDCWKSKEPK